MKFYSLNLTNKIQVQAESICTNTEFGYYIPKILSRKVVRTMLFVQLSTIEKEKSEQVERPRRNLA